MKKLNHLAKKDLSEEQIDNDMKDLLNDKFNKELRDKYSEKLKDEYGVDRNEKTQEFSTQPIENQDIKESSKSQGSIKWLFPLLLVGILAFGTYLMQNATKNSNKPIPTEQLVNQYFASNDIDYIDNNRSVDEIGETRNLAIENFEKKDYLNAARYFGDVSNQTSQDQFFSAYSYFKAGSFKEAANIFTQFINKADGDNYIPEAKVYQILCMIKLGESDSAKQLYNQLKVGSWEQEELKEIVSSMQ